MNHIDESKLQLIGQRQTHIKNIIKWFQAHNVHESSKQIYSDRPETETSCGNE